MVIVVVGGRENGDGFVELSEVGALSSPWFLPSASGDEAKGFGNFWKGRLTGLGLALTVPDLPSK
jgi:hypothetical protein